jgi:hypothetical protein
MKHIARLILVIASLLSTGAFAQWQWMDKDGRKVFSDRSPPANVPEKNILKRPGQLSVVAVPDRATASETPGAIAPAAVASAQPAVSASKPGGVDKDLAEKKKKADQAEADKRKAEADRIAKVKADNCARAKQSKAAMDSGMRMGRVDKQGEREILDEAARASEAAHIKSVIDSDCK